MQCAQPADPLSAWSVGRHSLTTQGGMISQFSLITGLKIRPTTPTIGADVTQTSRPRYV